MDILIPLIIVLVAFGYFFCMHPALMKEIFSFKKKPVEPVEPDPEPVTPVSGKSISRADSLAYEDMGYINEPIQAPVVLIPRHEIIKHDYYRSLHSGNMWPRWTCRCGATGYEPTSIYEPLEATQRSARHKGQRHVEDALKADEMLAKSDGKFAF